MKYLGKQITKKESVKKHTEHIKSNEICFATSDGNCFIGDRAPNTAHSHASLFNPSLLVFDLHSKDDVSDRNSGANPARRGRDSQETAEETVELTLKELMKLKAVDLQAKATEMGVEFETDANKRTIANAILDSVENTETEETTAE